MWSLNYLCLDYTDKKFVCGNVLPSCLNALLAWSGLPGDFICACEFFPIPTVHTNNLPVLLFHGNTITIPLRIGIRKLFWMQRIGRATYNMLQSPASKTCETQTLLRCRIPSEYQSRCIQCLDGITWVQKLIDFITHLHSELGRHTPYLVAPRRIW